MSPRSESECIPESELYELFRPRRADPEAFRRGVERHVEAKRASGEEGSELKAAQEPRAPAWLRRAAALLPGDPLAGALGGAAAGKLAGAKFLPAALALPALLLGSALGAFAAGARSLRRSARDAQPYEPIAHGRWGRHARANGDLLVGTSLLQAMQFGSLLVLLVAPLLGGTWAVDALFLVLLVSMAALALSVRGFARAGLLERAGVARLCAGVLTSTFMGCFLWLGAFRLPDSASELGLGWSVAVVMLGVPLCLAFASATRALLAVLAWSVCLLLLNPLACTRTTPGALREQLAEIELDPLDLSGWQQAAALHRALVETGHALPDLASLQRAVAAAIEAEDPDPRVWKEGEDVHPLVWTAALEMGLIDVEHRARLAQHDPFLPRKLDDLRSGTRALRLVESDEYLFWLLRDAQLSPEERASLAERLEAYWPELGQHGALGRALLCVRALDLLGLSERADALRARAHALLVAHWVPRTRVFGNPGGFSPNPEKFLTSMDEPTWQAVELMTRFGVPDGIDTRLLRGHLRTGSRGLAVIASLPEFQAYERAALLVLEEEIGLPPRNTLQRVLDERLFLTSVLIVALCLLAIRLAPALEKRAGAQP